MELTGKKVLVFGAGKSGIGSVTLLEKVGANPVLYDGSAKLQEGEVRKKLPQNSGAAIVLGELSDELIGRMDLCVLSPGVPTDCDPVLRIRAAGVPVWGEVELAYQCSKGGVMAVTGTNGKTTTTSLLGEIMKRHLGEDRVFVVGNIGNPYTDAALQTDERSVCVAEISSFQLETIHEFHPHIAAVTNITPDHLNRHHTMEEYIRVKESISENQGKDDFLVLNAEDSVLYPFGEAVKDRVQVLYFSSAKALDEGMYLEGGELKIRLKKESPLSVCLGEDAHPQEGGYVGCTVIRTEELNLLGKHNFENVSTAVLCALAAQVPLDEIREVLRSFQAVEHRIEFVREKNGVTYYNDSKGTNPDAAIRAVLAMNRPTVLIGGGYDKQSSYDEWVETFAGRVKELVLIGETADAIEACARKHGFTAIHRCGTFREAFDACVELARPGDCVLLSPACASWDMFPNYEERGRIFKEYVNGLS